jgi:hypothetical protein
VGYISLALDVSMAARWEHFLEEQVGRSGSDDNIHHSGCREGEEYWYRYAAGCDFCVIVISVSAWDNLIVGMYCSYFDSFA